MKNKNEETHACLTLFNRDFQKPREGELLSGTILPELNPAPHPLHHGNNEGQTNTAKSDVVPFQTTTMGRFPFPVHPIPSFPISFFELLVSL